MSAKVVVKRWRRLEHKSPTRRWNLEPQKAQDGIRKAERLRERTQAYAAARGEVREAAEGEARLSSRAGRAGLVVGFGPPGLRCGFALVSATAAPDWRVNGGTAKQVPAHAPWVQQYIIASLSFFTQIVNGVHALDDEGSCKAADGRLWQITESPLTVNCCN